MYMVWMRVVRGGASLKDFAANYELTGTKQSSQFIKIYESWAPLT